MIHFGFKCFVDDLKIAQNLAIESSAYLEHVRNGIVVFIHVCYFLKFFNSSVGFVAKEFDKLVGMLCKTIKFGSVASGNGKQAINSDFLGLAQNMVNGRNIQTELSSNLCIRLLVTQPNGIEGIMF